MDFFTATLPNPAGFGVRQWNFQGLFMKYDDNWKYEKFLQILVFLSIFSTNFHKTEPPAQTMRVRENLKIYFLFAQYPSCSGESKYGTHTFLIF